MRQRVIFSLLWIVLPGSLMAQGPVYIPDPLLKQAIEEKLQVFDPTPDDMLGLTSLTHVENEYKTPYGIDDLTGLEYAINLQQLNLRFNNISDISPLAGLTQLMDLNLSENYIDSISPLSHLTNLVDLNIHANSIGNLNPLSDLTKLAFLDAHNNEITDLSGLSNLTRLETLSLFKNPITDLTGLSKLTHLTTLLAYDASITRIDAIAPLNDLVTLDISRNQIVDISALSSMNELEELFLNDNDITEVSALTSHRRLKTLLLLDNNLQGTTTYCQDLPTIARNNPGLILEYDSNPSFVSTLTASQGLYSNKVLLRYDPVCNGPIYTTYYRIHRSSTGLHTRVPISAWHTQLEFEDVTAVLGVHYTYWLETAISDRGLDRHFATTESGSTGWLSTMPSLAISHSNGGGIKVPGAGLWLYPQGTRVHVQATPSTPGYIFIGWTGSAVDAGMVDAPQHADTWVTLNDSYALKAHFTTNVNRLYVTQYGNTGSADGSYWHPFNSIQSAIDRADHGTTIIVGPGHYRESITLAGKNVTLTGINPDDPNTITAYPVLSSNSGSPTLSFLNHQETQCTVSNLVITQSHAPVTSAIHCLQSSPHISNCLIVGNQINSPDTHHGTVFCQESQATFTHCTIADNKGVGIALSHSHVTLRNSILWNNQPDDIHCPADSQIGISFCNLSSPRNNNLSVLPHVAQPGQWHNGLWIPGDYHLLSRIGRFEPITGQWTKDLTTSPGVDTGDPATPIRNEPAPHGHIVNLGAYGNSAQASLSDPENLFVHWKTPVGFRDDRLQELGEEALGVSNPNFQDMLRLTTLHASNPQINNQIRDLTGLEYASHLTHLNLKFNQIDDITPLTRLSSLTTLDLSSNFVGDLTPLENLSKLKTLTLKFNRVQTIQPLLTLTNLDRVDLRNNPLNQMAYDSHLDELRRITTSLFYNPQN
jgi:Leucine-rich repeat (LRR) protein